MKALFWLFLPISVAIFNTNAQKNQHLITGGEATKSVEFPFIVGLWSGNDTEDVFVGEGVLIREDFVLTSALLLDFFQCKHHTKQLKFFEIVAGDHDKTSDSSQTANISKVYQHPEYKPYPCGNKSTQYTIATADLALIRLESNFTLSKTVQTIALPTHTPNEATGVVVSLNATGDDDESTILQMKEESACMAEYEKYHSAKYNKTTQFCAGNAETRLCDGRGGTPFLLGHEKVLFGIGAMWNTLFCDDDNDNHASNFFTRVMPYVPWIKSVMKGERENDHTTMPTISSRTQKGTGSACSTSTFLQRVVISFVILNSELFRY